MKSKNFSATPMASFRTRWLFLFIAVALLPGCKNPEKVNKDQDVVLRFAVASDGHYGQPGTGYKGSFELLVTNLNREKVEKGLDFVVLNGDIFHNNPDFLPEVKEALSGLIMPVYAVRGNHDRATEKKWERTWGIPDNYDFEAGKYAVILASTSDTSGAYLCADHNWLWNRLDHYQDKKGVFVFMHITPKKWTTHGIDCPEVLNALESHPNVKAVFQGHDHNQDSMKVSNGIPYYFDGHFGGSWGTTFRGYRIVEVKNNGLIRTYEYNMDITPVVNENLQHLAFLHHGKLTSEPSEKYAGAPALTDGVFGTLNFRDGKWTGFEGTDFEWTLNLGQMTTLHQISIRFLVNRTSLIFSPDTVEFLVSSDGNHFNQVFFQENSKNELIESPSIQRYSVDLNEVPCKMVKLRATHREPYPGKVPGSDQKGWLFADEIVLN